jgi:hypothetical protein
VSWIRRFAPLLGLLCTATIAFADGLSSPLARRIQSHGRRGRKLIDAEEAFRNVQNFADRAETRLERIPSRRWRR